MEKVNFSRLLIADRVAKIWTGNSIEEHLTVWEPKRKILYSRF